MRRLERGRRLYDCDVLRGYVEEERQIIDRVRPALVVGDFRLSLAVSAALSGVRCAMLINAYWSPYGVRASFPVPDHPIVRLLGFASPSATSRAVGAAFAYFAAPVNELRESYGLPRVDSLLGALTQGDLVLYPDIPELCPTHDLPGHHHYLGYVPWAPDVALPPDFRAEAEGGIPLVYVTLGSSGRTSAAGRARGAGRAPRDRVARERRRELPPSILTTCASLTTCPAIWQHVTPAWW